MPRKAQMNANYRRNEKLLEDGEIDVPTSGGVSQEYVDNADTTTLAEAKAYTDDEIADIPDELPAIVSSDIGKALKVNATGDGVEWDTVNEVPNPTASDVNKVLTATAANTFAWMAAGGGSGSQWNNVYSIMDLNRNDIFIGRVVTDDPDSQLFTNYVIGIVGSANATIISFSNCIAIDSTGTALSGAQEFEGFTTYYVTGIKYTLQ